MKCMTSNRMCSYACLANLLLDFSIDTEDVDIIKTIHIPYIFKFDDIEDNYIAGPMLQGKKWFDYYLNPLGFEFFEKELSKDDVLDFLKSQKCMIGLRIGNSGKHAVIYEGIENKNYKFLNVKRQHSDEPDYYYFNEQELLERIDDRVYIGWIKQSRVVIPLNNIDEVKSSIITLEKYRKKVIDFCSEMQDYHSIEKAKYSLFEALFLDTLTMMEIINNDKIARHIIQLRGEFIQTLKLKCEATLSHYLSMEIFNQVIEDYKKVIESYIDDIQ